MTLILDPSDPTIAAWMSGQGNGQSPKAASKQSVYRARWKAKNRGRQREYDARYASQHREQKRAAFKRWYYANRERAVARVIAWRRARSVAAP